MFRVCAAAGEDEVFGFGVYSRVSRAGELRVNPKSLIPISLKP